MNLEDWFQKGMTAQEYVDSMDKFQKDLIYIYEHFNISTEDYPFFEKLQKKDIRAVVLTEDWCGDAMLNVPIFLRLAEAGHIETHFLRRDENLELMDKYLTNGKSRSIPIIIFIDRDGEEICSWGPRAPELQTFLDDSIGSLPEKETKDYQEKQKQMFTFITKAYRDHQNFWHYVYKDMIRTLA